MKILKIILLLSAVLIAPTASFAKTYSCIPAIKIVIDLGYCFGFTTSYFEAIDDQKTLTAIETGHVQKHINEAHQQCYPTKFDNQMMLGTLAFSSYINMKDDRLLKDTANNCQLLMKHFADQNKTVE